jgi:uncharacterized membrane protein
MALCPPIRGPWGGQWRSLAAIAAVTTAVTFLFMQIEGPAPAAGGNYQTPSWAVAIHLATVLPALLLAPVVFARRKGDSAHRMLGSVWMVLMVATATASFWIRGESGAFSGIHLFSVGTLIAVPMAVWRARARDIRAHRQIMISLYVGLIVAGLFALAPDRIAGRFVWGPPAGRLSAHEGACSSRLARLMSRNGTPTDSEPQLWQPSRRKSVPGLMTEDEVESLRAQAQKCRDIAAGTVTPDARMTLLDIASEYETRAEKLEQRKAAD